MVLLSFIFKNKQKKSDKESTKKASYIFDSVFPNNEIYEIAMGIRTEEDSEK